MTLTPEINFSYKALPKQFDSSSQWCYNEVVQRTYSMCRKYDVESCRLIRYQWGRQRETSELQCLVNVPYVTNGMDSKKKDSAVLTQYMYVCTYSAPKANARERNFIVFRVHENICIYVCMYSAPKANARERNFIVFRVHENICMYVCMYSASKANARERNFIVFRVHENVCMYVCMYSAPKANARERNCIVFSAQSKCEGERLYCIHSL